VAITAPPEAWERLSRLLLERRIRIDRRYRNRRLFADERHMNYKLVADIERHLRTDFGDDTIIALEMAYAWETGSIERVLKGGEPVPVPLDGQGSSPEPDPEPDGTYPPLDAWFEKISPLPQDEYDREIGAAMRRAQEIRDARRAAAAREVAEREAAAREAEREAS
jgi:hypothetical protein